MGLLTKIQLLLKHLQFIGLLKSIDIPFPKVYINFSSISNLISLDPSFLQSIDANFPVLTFRLQFFLIAVAIPLLIMLLTLVVFVNFTTIMWILYSISGIMLLVVYITNKVQVNLVGDGLPTDRRFLAVMVVVLAFCVAYRSLSRLFKRDQLPVVIVKNLLSALMMLGGGCMVGFDLLSLRILLAACMFNLMCYVYKSQIEKFAKVIGILFMSGGVAVFWTQTNISMVGVFPQIMAIPGYLNLAFGIAGYVQFLMYSNVDKGFGKAFVQARKKVQALLDRSLLAVAFFFLSSAFVPVITSCLQLFVCKDFNCPAGTKFNPFLPVDYTVPWNSTQEAVFCDACDFSLEGSACKLDPLRVCPQYNRSMLLFHPDTPCSDAVSWYYRIAAIVVMIVFVVIVSALYVGIIRFITQNLAGYTRKTYNDLLAHYRSLCDEYELAKVRTDERQQIRRVRSEIIRNKLERSFRGPLGATDDPFSDSPDPLDIGIVVPEKGPSVPPPPPSLSAGMLIQDDSMFDQGSLSTPLIATTVLATSKVPPRPQRRRGSTFFDSREQPKTEDEELKELFDDDEKAEKKDEKAEKPEEPTGEDALLRVNGLVDPKASSLYNSYRPAMCYFILGENFHRLSLVAVSVFVSPKYREASVINFALHAVYMIVLMGLSPYTGRLEQLIAVVVAVCDSLSAAYATLLWLLPDSDTVTSESFGIVVLVIGIVPIVCGVAGQILDMRKTLVNPYAKQAEKERKEREEEMQRQIDVLQERLDNSDLLALSAVDIEKIEEKIEALKNPEELEHEKLTNSLNSMTKKQILFVFAVAAIPLMLGSCGLTIYATLKDVPSEFVDGSQLLVRTPDVVLGGKGSWEAFTSECCCFQSNQPIKGFNVTERWVCADLGQGGASPSALIAKGLYSSGVTVSRNRVSKVQSTGLPIRGLCQSNFSINCSVSVSPNEVSLSCPVSSLSELNITDYAQRYLW